MTPASIGEQLTWDTIAALKHPGAIAREVRVLAAFLRDEFMLLHADLLGGLPAAADARIKELRQVGPPPLGGIQPGDASFREASDEDAVEGLFAHRAEIHSIVGELRNLSDFQWVSIPELVAGSLVARFLPEPSGVPDRRDIRKLTEFCLTEPWYEGSPSPIVGAQHEPTFHLGIPAQLRYLGSSIEVVDGVHQLAVRYALSQRFSPMRVSILHGRAILVAGLERAIALLRAGIREALVLVSFGPGEDALRIPPKLPPSVLLSARPPVVADFLSESCAVAFRAARPPALLRMPLVAVGS